MRSGSTSSIDMGPKVQRALNMLKLQHLEDMYADRARPRYVKLCTEFSITLYIVCLSLPHCIYVTHDVSATVYNSISSHLHCICYITLRFCNCTECVCKTT